MKNILERSILALLFVCSISGIGNAQVVWDGSESSDWTDGDNWVGGSAPGDGDDVTINAGAPNYPVISTDISSGGTIEFDNIVMNGGSIEVTTGGTLRTDGGDADLDILGGTFTISGGTVFIDDDIDPSGGAIVLSSGTLEVDDNLRLTGTGTFTMTGGNLEVNDNVSVIGSNTSFSASGGNIDIEDNLDIESGASFTLSGDVSVDRIDNIDVDASTFTISGTASIGGTETIDSIDLTNGATMNQGAGTTLTLSGDIDVEDSSFTTAGNISVTGNDDLEIFGNSTVIINDPANLAWDDIEMKADGDGSSSTLTINGGTIDLADNIKFNNTAEDDQIIMNGGTLNVTDEIQNLDGSGGSIQVNGGTLNAGTIENNALADEINASGSGVVTEGGVGVLPVELLSFSGTVTNGRIEITWITAAELNNEFFELQRSLDGEHFEIISVIQGNGTTNVQSTYKYFDDQILSDLVFYRLEQFDHDGKSEILPTISINTNNSSPSQDISVFPNPTATYLQVTMASKAGEAVSSISIMDMNGKVVWLNNDFNGFQKIDLMALGLKEGMYLVRLLQGDYQTTKRVIFKPSF